MSKYATDMRTALQTYRSTKQRASLRLEQIRDEYGDEAARREQERQESQLSRARASAEAAIREAYSEGHYLAEQWGKPDGSSLTDDMKLFDAGLVTPAVFDQLKERYRSNATMSAALKAQGEKLNKEAQQEAANRGEFLAGMQQPYNTRDIETADDKMKYWDGLKSRALDLLDAIDGTGRYSDSWEQALGRAMVAETIDNFGE